MIKLVAFLGNFEARYDGTRHNVAWSFCDYLEETSPISWSEKYKGLVGAISARGEKILTVKPLTFMNLSGECVGQVASFYKLVSEEVLVVHDELELPFGVVSFKAGGGLGGHNGLRSVKAALGSDTFFRLRFGLTKPQDTDIANYVLSKFSPTEEEKLPAIFSLAKTIFTEALSASDPTPLAKKWAKTKADFAQGGPSKV